MSDYSIHLANIFNDENTIVNLWNESFPETLGFKHKYSWLYVNNLYKNADLFLLQNNDEKVGVQGVSGRKFECDGELLSVGLVGDFAVSPSHRTLGPGLKLLKHTMASGINSNAFIYSFPNINAIPVVKRSGYKLQKNINRYAKIIKSKVYINKYLPVGLSIVVSPILNFLIYCFDAVRFLRTAMLLDYEFCSDISKNVNELWAKSTFKKNYLMQIRDKEYIDWRVKEDISRKVEFFQLIKKGKLLGYIAYIYKKERKSIIIVDFFVCEQSNMIRALFNVFVFKIRSKNINAISVEYMGSKNIENEIKSVGFKIRDKRPVFYKINDHDVSKFNSNELFLTSWDEDAV